MTLTVSDRLEIPRIPRIGVNIEGSSWYGADQLSSNVIVNPGLEPTIDRTIVQVKDATSTGFADDNVWLTRADGFWNGGSFQVLTGASAGQAGAIASSIRRPSDGLGWFTTAGSAPPLAPGDILSVMRTQKAGPPSNWGVPPGFKGLVVIRPGVHPPGVPGDSSAELTLGHNDPTELNSYLTDSHKFLPVVGHWRLSFWARTTQETAALSVYFGRVIPPSVKFFIRHDQNVDSHWTHTTLEFDNNKDDVDGTLKLSFLATGRPGVALQLANVELGRVSDLDGGAWRAEVIGALKRIRPGYLRDWQGQLGDTMSNRIAPSFARSPERYFVDQADQNQAFLYSIPDFFELCQTVGARPWIVAPTTFYDSEFSALGEYLARAQRIYEFHEIVVEFGNENWNPTFRGAGIINPIVMGQAANHAFRLIRKSTGSGVPLHLVVNGLYAYPPVAAQALESAPAADAVDVGPYFFYTLNAHDSDAAAVHEMIAPDDERTQLANLRETAGKLGKTIDVYEVNLSTTGGDAPAAQRNPLVAGMISGVSLANRLIEGMYAGIQRQNVWNFAQYNLSIPSGGSIKLFGITHDLGTPASFRPTGLAVEMLNRAIAGDFHPVASNPAGAGVNAAAFLSPAGWSLALVSTNSSPTDVTVELPSQGIRPSRVLTLVAPTLFADNETYDQVKISVAALPPNLKLSIPAYGFVVLLPPTDPQ